MLIVATIVFYLKLTPISFKICKICNIGCRVLPHLHGLGIVYILVNTNLKLNDLTRRLRTPSRVKGAIIGPASGQ